MPLPFASADQRLAPDTAVGLQSGESGDAHRAREAYTLFVGFSLKEIADRPDSHKLVDGGTEPWVEPHEQAGFSTPDLCRKRQQSRMSSAGS